MTEACRVIRDRSELVAYFNRLAVGYRKPMAPRPSTRIPIGADPPELPKTVGVLLEIGCGNAIHLAELASAFSHLIGADISPGMVDAAWAKGANLPYRDRIDLHVDPAEEPRTIDDASVGVVLCLGAPRASPAAAFHAYPS